MAQTDLFLLFGQIAATAGVELVALLVRPLGIRLGIGIDNLSYSYIL